MDDTLAVIETGGKQILVQRGRTFRIEKIAGEPGSEVTFTDVLLVANVRDAGTTVRVGAPKVEGASVTGTVLKQGRHDKVVGVKMKAKKRYRRKFGHRQHFTEVTINEIRG